MIQVSLDFMLLNNRDLIDSGRPLTYNLVSENAPKVIPFFTLPGDREVFTFPDMIGEVRESFAEPQTTTPRAILEKSKTRNPKEGRERKTEVRTRKQIIKG